uniref:HVA22-like protein a n=1 Tax=Erigeron canadensis TaxID=72917 RepID=UPI001CB8A31D|nr:HVA22-like protein a [Erigeron canadensis]
MGRSGAAAGDLLLLIAQNIDVLAGPLVSLAYPLYASIRAIETKNTADDQQWLTYWVLYSMITLFELTFYTLVDWIPFWSYLKLVITCWLVIPQFSGATYVYQHYVRPFYTGDKTAANLWNVPSKKHNLTPISAQDDILVSGDKYTHEYRPDETIQYANVGGGVNYRGNTFFSEDDYGY